MKRSAKEVLEYMASVLLMYLEELSGVGSSDDPFLYGEKMRAYLIRGAGVLPGFDRYPNPQTGWGTLCAYNSLFF